MKIAVSRLVTCLCLVFLATACVQTPPGKSFPELRYSHLDPIGLAVNSVEVRTVYVSPGKAPNVEHEFPVKPAAAAERWVQDRIRARGGPDRLRATVTKGSVVEVPLKRTTGIRGAFTTDQSERYDGELELRLEIFAPNGTRRAMVSSRATRTRTVAEDVTLSEREDIWFRITEAMMNDLNRALEHQIAKHFTEWRR